MQSDRWGTFPRERAPALARSKSLHIKAHMQHHAPHVGAPPRARIARARYPWIAEDCD